MDLIQFLLFLFALSIVFEILLFALGVIFFNTTKIQQKQNQISIIQSYALIKKAARQKAALQKMNQKKYIRIDHKYTFDLSVFYIFEITKI